MFKIVERNKINANAGVIKSNDLMSDSRLKTLSFIKYTFSFSVSFVASCGVASAIRSIITCLKNLLIVTMHKFLVSLKEKLIKKKVNK